MSLLPLLLIPACGAQPEELPVTEGRADIQQQDVRCQGLLVGEDEKLEGLAHMTQLIPTVTQDVRADLQVR